MSALFRCRLAQGNKPTGSPERVARRSAEGSPHCRLSGAPLQPRPLPATVCRREDSAAASPWNSSLYARNAHGFLYCRRIFFFRFFYMINLAKYAGLKICVAVSGGRDSMALLHYLNTQFFSIVFSWACFPLISGGNPPQTVALRARANLWVCSLTRNDNEKEKTKVCSLCVSATRIIGL